RIPTGGGKTWLAAKSVQLVNTHLLRSDYSVILWLVPSNAIRKQTLKCLKDRQHPYHAALREAGPVTVIDLEEAKSVSRATLETSTTVIVSTVQAFKREDTEGLKVYESNGALMHHFDGLTSEQRAHLMPDNGSGAIPYSLANVLRLRRPFIIVDEAHNNRTELSFETLARFRPSGIMELTATPDTEHTPSNVLHSVGAGELKAEEMIKLPILLATEPDADKCLANAIARRDELHELARQERQVGANYLRPVVLIQAEPRRQGVETRDVDWVYARLTGENFGIPADEVVIATGEARGLDEIAEKYDKGILDENCPVKYVITQRALAEGWDCPFAYILVSMAELRSSTAVEQLLGRILRQPDAQHRHNAALNQSYAFVVSRDFGATAASLQDGLVNSAGFNARDAADFVAPATSEQQHLDFGRPGARAVARPVVVQLPEKPAMRSIPKS
ncbi:MAG: restriction endonuclease subunit R, partial [Alphaproteobacteria bacterium]